MSYITHPSGSTHNNSSAATRSYFCQDYRNIFGDFIKHNRKGLEGSQEKESCKQLSKLCFSSVENRYILRKATSCLPLN